MTLDIANVHLGHAHKRLAGELFTVRCDGAVVQKVFPATEAPEPAEVVVDGKGGILLPSLCHSHIHLDKCFILEKGDPLVTGDFPEALEVTSRVKASFKNEVDDLHARGTRLIRESVECGVTSMRAHIEVDQVVDMTCVNVGLRLKKEWAKQCDVQLSLFMQEPLFDAEGDRSPGQNAFCLVKALSQNHRFSAIGSAPYVECDDWQAKWNIRYVLQLAMDHDLHADFHLDYTLAPSAAPLIYFLLDELHALDWAGKMPGKTVTVGHATRLALFGAAELRALRARIGRLPVALVGLPQSDVYMMGRGDPAGPRGTLRVPQLVRDYGLDVAMSVNNVANAFTPQGTADPLALCPLGVAVYQTAAEDHCRTLLEAVTVRSKRAIGDLHPPRDLAPAAGDAADFVILHGNASVQSAVLAPCWDRTTVKAGIVVARRTSSTWTSYDDTSQT